MTHARHWTGLEALFAASPTNARHGARLTVGDGAAKVQLVVVEEMFHAAGAAHASHVFKLLDDAAFFAASSRVEDNFLFTVSFTLQLLQPMTLGPYWAEGHVIKVGRTMLWADSTLYRGAPSATPREKPDPQATGTGVFMRSRLGLAETVGYS